MSKTKIEYVDLTINPVVGCSKCSPGCDNCYAERMAARLSKNPLTAAKYAGVVDANGKWSGQITFDLSCFDKLPKKPQRIFIGSMTDIFLQKIKEEDGYLKTCLPQLWEKFNQYHQHIFILLTKRPENMKTWIDFIFEVWTDMLENNVWLGVTACNRDELHKLDTLRQTPAAKRFVSFEPLLGDVGSINLSDIDWVICGGETGPGARPMHPDWVRSLRDQCHSAEVPFFFKGMIENGKKTRLLDGREWNEVPE